MVWTTSLSNIQHSMRTKCLQLSTTNGAGTGDLDGGLKQHGNGWEGGCWMSLALQLVVKWRWEMSVPEPHPDTPRLRVAVDDERQMPLWGAAG